MSETIPVAKGRELFGGDPVAYERARPAYPPEIFDGLRDRCGLRPGIAAFEIGPGPGTVSGHLLDAGVARLVAVEPDRRLAAYMRARFEGQPQLDIINAPFEDADLPPSAFDLGIAATSFHWVGQARALQKVGAALRSGGWWACWWNVFSDGARDDAFQQAIRPLFKDLPRSHSETGRGTPFPLNTAARIADLKANGDFENIEAEIFRWTATLDAERIRDLYASFSVVAALEPEKRARFLDALHEIASRDFAGQVDRPMSASLYTARRR